MGEGEQRRSKIIPWRFVLLLLLGGGGGAAGYFRVWDQYVPARIQSMVGLGALASPEKLGATASDKVRQAALGQRVRWKAKVVEVRRPLIGDPLVVCRSGDAIVHVRLPSSADAQVKALSPGAEFEFEGRIAKLPPGEILVEDASIAK